MALIPGDDTNNTLNGTDEADTILGYGGEDILLGNAGDDSLFGGEGSDHLDGGAGADWLHGGGGLDYASYYQYTGGNLVVDLMNTAVNTGWAAGDVFTSIEGLIGSTKADKLYGDNGINFLYGEQGNDVLDGRGGNDYPYGGEGNDILIGGGGADKLDGGADTDTASYATALAGLTVSLGDASINTGDAAGDTFISIENLIGSEHDDVLIGDGGENVIQGGEGQDTIDGGGGNDTMFGGDGHDLYFVTEAGDIVFEYMNQGWDVVWSNLDSYTLTSNVEGLSLVGSALQGIGNDLDNNLIGNELNNTLFGGDGSDSLFGGLGADVLDGGKGIDWAYYMGAAATDAATNTGLLVDMLDPSVNTGEAAGDTFFSVEGVYGSQFNDILRGDNGNNILEGDSGNDTLYGRDGDDLLKGQTGNDILNGGAGIDSMAGGSGNDKYYVDNAGDVIVEAVGGGTADRVYASVNYQLAAGAEVEILNTSSNGGTAAINLVGNNFAQTIIGNAGANIINGLGGADTMNGLGGNDKYYVDNTADVIVEAAGGGTADRVLTSVNYSLKSGVEVELLTTTNAAGTDALKLAGNAFANTVIGNAGNNFLNGAAGADTLTGLGGNDIFMFNTAIGGGNIDNITDFNVADDTIRLDNAIFASIAGTGVLTAAQFVANATGTAQDADDRIIYETDTGRLIYDANGSTAGGRYLFATLDAGLAVTNADFFIV